jgi:glycosyltransferase involved in cell wall biosynthesis
MKNTCVVYAPISTFSGYGANSRTFVKNLVEIKGHEWDIKVVSCKWGNTPMNFIEENPEWKWLENHIISPHLQKQPDYMFWITIPSEAQKVGKWNCLVTAGIESTACPSDWIEGCNKMDLVIVSSEHAKKSLINTQYEIRNNKTNIHEGMLKVNVPVEVIGEGVNTDLYKILDKSTFDLNYIKEDFCYLFLGMWIGNENIPIGEDRKNVGLLIKAFYDTFKNKKKKPALILKTSHVGSSYMDREEILKKIKNIRKKINSTDLPNIYLIHGELTDEEINQLYNHPKVKAMVNFTKGEGYGKPLLEFSLMKKPILTTNWSGHLDFLHPNFSTLVGGKLTNIHPAASNKWLIKEAQWFSPDLMQVGFSLKDIFENYKNYKEKAKRQSFYSKSNFSLEKIKEKLTLVLEEKTPKFPVEMEIKLPPLKKIELPSLKRIES